MEKNLSKVDVVVISGTNHYEERNKKVIEEYKKQGKTVCYLTSDFHHIKKCQYKFEQEDTVQIHVLPYHKNISVLRLLSHFMFSCKAYRYLKKLKPEIVYTEIPNNSLAYTTAKYRKRNKCELIFDIFDMWPEALPVKTGNPILKIAFKIWGDFRNKNLKYADKIYTECNYYQEILGKEGYHMPMETKYLCQDDVDLEIETHWSEKQIDICYVGSINNIIDIPLMGEFLSRLNQKRKVYFHLIGQGESKERIKRELVKRDVNVIDYGSVYDKIELQKIFNKCSFGINFLVPDVAIGITMKSVTYLRGGVLLLNTVDGDTRKFVSERSVGINVEKQEIDKTIEKLLDLKEEQFVLYKQNARKLFLEEFTR